MIHITDTIALDDHEIQERFVRATGSGGQNRAGFVALLKRAAKAPKKPKSTN